MIISQKANEQKWIIDGTYKTNYKEKEDLEQQ